MLQKLSMKLQKHKDIPARMSPGQKRSALPVQSPDGSEKSARGRCGVRVGTANVGTMRGRSGEVVDMADRRCLDFCCLQETRWKSSGARTIGKYKFFWSGCSEGTAGVGILVKESWVDKVLEVKRINERIIVLRVRVGDSAS